MKWFPISTICFLFLLSCRANTDSTIRYVRYTYDENNYRKQYMPGHEIQLFKGTPVWQLAVAVYDQDTDKIKALAKQDTSLLSYQEPKLKFTLLHWAIFNDRYFSAKALLMAGANPNSVSTDGDTPFILAASRSETSEYLKLILPYAGNVNAEAPVDARWHTPLEAAARSRLESVKLLIEKGADVNHVSRSKSTALYAACLNDIATIHYLVIEQGANTLLPIVVFDDGTRFYASDFIEDMSFPKGSKEYKMKMEVIDYIKKHENDK